MNNSLTKTLLILAALGVLAWLAAPAPAQPGSGKPDAPKPLPEGAAAVVNGEVIPLQKVYDALYRQYGQSILDQMIKARLAEQEAKRLNVTVNAKEVGKKVEEWKNNFLSRFNNDEKAANEMLSRQGTSLESTLAYMRNYHNTENLWAQLVRHKKKPDWASLKGVFEQRYGSDGLKLDVAHIVLTTNINDPRYADRYPEKEHYRRIEEVEKQAAEKAKQVANRARAGEDFARLAETESDDWSKSNGGKLGEFWKNRFGQEFEQAVEKASIGDVIGPMPIKDGFVVAKLEPAEFDTTYSARHIFLPFGKNDRDEVLARAQALKTQLDEGADFAQLAREKSQDPLTRENGGLWEPFQAGEKVSQIASALERLQPGQITDVIPTRYGAHIVQLVKKERVPKGDKKAVSIVLVSTQYAQVREKFLKPLVEKETIDKARTLIQQLQNGANFAELARKNSDEKFTGERGGQINGYNKNRISPEFHAVVDKLKPNQVAPEPIKSQYGYHVVKLLDRTTTTFDKVKNELFEEEKQKPPSPAEVQRLQELLMNTADIQKRK